MRFRQLSYANENDPRLKRWFIRSMEGLAGRDRYARLYDIWRTSIVGTSARVFGDMLDLRLLGNIGDHMDRRAARRFDLGDDAGQRLPIPRRQHDAGAALGSQPGRGKADA